jgi:Putative transposase
MKSAPVKWSATTMTLAPGEFIRRVLLHVLPKGFHRIRHTGFLASSGKAENIAKARVLLTEPASDPASVNTPKQVAAAPARTCPCCGGAMHIVETFERGETPRHRAEPSRLVVRIDTS